MSRHSIHRRLRAGVLAALLVVVTATVAACGGTSVAPSGGSATTTVPASTGSQVLPVTDNPIRNTSTNQVLKIDSVLVENNVDAAGNAADDHLEIALSNTGTTDLSGFEVYYTFADSITGATESYYFRLPDSFTIPAGGARTIHFDNTGTPDHFPVNEFSLYYTSANALDVTVVISTAGAALQTAAVQKDAGGEEAAD
jgi:hypothetical protein